MKADQRQHGFTLINVVMGGLVPIAGIAITIILLKKFTPLPFWACAVLSVPAFMALFLGGLYLLGRWNKK